MSTSKPPRNRTVRALHPRTAPTYKRLADDAYAALDEIEKARHDLHIDIDAIIDATPYATRDRDAIGFATAGGQHRNTSTPDPTSAAALNTHHDPAQQAATNWLAEAKEARSQITRTANQGRYHYGYDPQRGRPETTRPEPKRIPQVHTCAYCGEPAPPGRDHQGNSLLRNVPNPDGGDIPIHATPCYWTVAKQALRAGTTIAAHLKTMSNVSNPKTAGA